MRISADDVSKLLASLHLVRVIAAGNVPRVTLMIQWMLSQIVSAMTLHCGVRKERSRKAQRDAEAVRRTGSVTIK
jgi:hypothetical protein